MAALPVEGMQRIDCMGEEVTVLCVCGHED